MSYTYPFWSCMIVSSPATLFSKSTSFKTRLLLFENIAPPFLIADVSFILTLFISVEVQLSINIAPPSRASASVMFEFLNENLPYI